ncbi:carbohydrate-binding family 9-like protein [Fulvivirgaceae bacterium BMA10]|uniref:Carbohydrate-binding family 9-like protein n=1 Tax=Splendidivirga corallicola TaxID=3051826 RepID=A0ABT8KI69_9BACT|nr:carbohydrate-binding family 9-like protein [Fulvivirgaceae bacterium BMA10]
MVKWSYLSLVFQLNFSALVFSNIPLDVQREFHKHFISFGDTIESENISIPKHYVCFRTNNKIKIDGEINEQDWNLAPWTEDFQDIEGDVKPKPRFRTRAKLLWDHKYLYIAAELEEPHIWATLKKDESIIYHDNDFEVFIDPDGDTHQYYELEVNAYGTKWDLMLPKPYKDGGYPINSWEITGLKVGVKLYGTLNKPDDTDDKWTIELALPWKVLKESAPGKRPPRDGDQWKLNFSRVQWDVNIENNEYVKKKDPTTGRLLPENNWVWSPQGIINMHYPEMWGLIQFSKSAVGTNPKVFVDNSNESIKLKLREIYNKQKRYRRKHGSYSSSAEELNLSKSLMSLKPEIKTTASMFEAVCYDQNTGIRWHIRSDGKIWRE